MSVELKLSEPRLREALYEAMSAADPFERAGAQAFTVMYQTDVMCIVDDLIETPVSRWLTQDDFDALVLGSLMSVLGARRVLAAQERLLVLTPKLCAIVHHHLGAAQSLTA